jgi:HPt (histidine-containing phosphotransfer) domain-containing protein
MVTTGTGKDSGLDLHLGLVQQGLWVLERKSLKTLYRSPQVTFWFPDEGDLAASFLREFPQFDGAKAEIAADDGEVYSTECRTRPAESRAVPVEIKVLPLAGNRLRQAGFDSSSILVLATDISRVKEKDFMLKSFSQVIDTNNRSIRAQKKKIEDLLNSMRQAIFSVNAEGVIGDAVSRFSSQVFGVDIQERTVFDTLYESLPADGEQISGVKSAFVAVFGEDDLQWGLYSDAFPKRVEYRHPAGDIRLLKVESLPIWNEDTQLCERVLFVVEDVTELERLEREVATEREKNQKNIVMIQELADLDRGVIESFLSTSNREIQRLQQGVETLIRSFERSASGRAEWKGLGDGVNELFRIAHTIKGNARTLKLSFIGTPAHETEQALDSLRGVLGGQEGFDSGAMQIPLVAARDGVMQIRLQYAAYSELSRRVFGIEDEFRKSLLQEVASLLDELERLFGQDLSERELGERSAQLLGVSHRIKASLRALHTMKGNARSLGKPEAADLVHRMEGRLSSLLSPGRVFSLEDWRGLGTDLRAVALLLRPVLMELGSRGDASQFGESFVRLKTALDSAQVKERGLPGVAVWHDVAATFSQNGLPGISSLLAIGEQLASEGRTLEVLEEALVATAEFYQELLGGKFASDAYLSLRQHLLTAYDSVETAEALRGSPFRSDPLIERQLELIERFAKLRLPVGVSFLQRDLLLLLDSKFGSSENGREAGASGSEPLPATTSVVERNFAALSRNFEKLPGGRELDRLLHELPFGSLRSRFDPMINDIARTLGKSVVVHWSGTQLLVDRRKMGILQEALLHLLRNSLDHGLEAKSARVLAGKAESGRIEILASRVESASGGCLVIRVSDDGAGVNLDRVLAKAQGLGLISEQAAREKSRSELLQLIFHPGLSTAEKVTQLSGRGVGMDVVLTGIRKLSGEAWVDSEPGKGTFTELKIPLS